MRAEPFKAVAQENYHQALFRVERVNTIFDYSIRQERGVYILVLTLEGELTVGRLGKHFFQGIYLYVGSALGPGGFQRLLRHQKVTLGQSLIRRWHIDYLLPQASELKALWLKTEDRLECSLAQLLSQKAAPALPGFGCSDCRCPTHLFQLTGKVTEITSALKELGLEAEIISLNGGSCGRQPV